MLGTHLLIVTTCEVLKVPWSRMAVGVVVNALLATEGEPVGAPLGATLGTLLGVPLSAPLGAPDGE